MSYTGKQLIRAAKKLGYQVKEGGKHTLVFDPVTGRRISTIQRGYIPKGDKRQLFFPSNDNYFSRFFVGRIAPHGYS